MYASGNLSVVTSTVRYRGSWYEIPYDIGEVTYDGATATTAGRVQSWIEEGPACGTTGVGGTERGLPWVANQYPRAGVPDAYPVSTSLGAGKNFASLHHLQSVIAGYIDHGVPIVVGVENGGHFNTVIGYWERSDGFWIYTAEPLDGWGRPYHRKPMRWRKIKLDTDVLPEGTGVLSGMILFGHGASCRNNGWAAKIDRAYSDHPTLCGYLRPGNEYACKIWCATRPNCVKCSKLIGCGIGYRRLESWMGRGTNWHACERR
jgi:hypothetical protein